MADRESYLRFLSRMGYDEKDVLPIFTPRERAQLTVLGALMEGLAQIDLPEYREVSGSEAAARTKLALALRDAGANTNVVVSELYSTMRADFAALRLPVFDNAYAGVFPTHTFNAQVRPEDGGYLILLDTGFFETIESAVTVLLAPWTHDQKVEVLAGIVAKYCRYATLTRRGELSKIRSKKESALEIATDLQAAEEVSTLLTNACERFVLAHEYAHIVCGHPLRRLREGPDVVVIATDREHEFEADMWALDALIRQTDRHDPRERLITYTGGLIWLGIGALIEEYRRRDQPDGPNDSHPPELERMRLLQTYYERLEWNLDFLGCGRIDGTFLSLVSDCSLAFGGTGIPLAKNTSLETFSELGHDERESARQLASLMGLSTASHARIAESEGGDEALDRLLRKLGIEPVKPTKPPFVSMLDSAHRAVRRAFWSIEILLVLVALTWFVVTGGIVLPAALAGVAAALAGFYARFAR